MRLNQNRLRELLLLIALCGFFFFFRLSAIGLLGPDEPRYAQIAREMLARHDWITPVLYGHSWLEKPILLYWGEMLAYLIYGVSDWAARIPSALAATVLVCGTFLMVRRIRHNARFDAALMIASSALVIGFARAAATDMLLAAPFALAMLAWYCWYQPAVESDERRARLWLVLFYALQAVATLAKGPVAAALAAMIVIVFCAARRDRRALLGTLDPIGIAVFLAIAAPWYVLVQMHTPEFFSVFFLKNNLARFGSNLYRHRQPFWYYIPVALAATVPWTVWLIHGIGDAIHGLRTGSSDTLSSPAEAEPGVDSPGVDSPGADSNAAPGFTFEIFLFLWAAVPIVFFSLSRSKLPGYILPSVPALLILAATAIHRRAEAEDRPHWLSICAHSVLLAAIAAAACMAPRLIFKLPLEPSALMIAAAAGTAIFLISVIALLTSGWRMLHFVTLLPVILAVGLFLRGIAPAFDSAHSARPIARLMQEIDQPGPLPVASFGLGRNNAFGLAFYLDRPVSPYEGLEVSPSVYEFPPAVPRAEHVLLIRSGSLPALRALLPGRELEFLASDRAQQIEIYLVSAAP
jgi:4-amino-4-deoxy-L-arabinose transferase-like glycosyltransferase